MCWLFVVGEKRTRWPTLTGDALLELALFALDEINAAISEYDECIKLDPNNDRAYLLRGIFKVFSNQSVEATVDLKKAALLDSTNVFAAIWLDILERLAGGHGHLQDYVSTADANTWPALLVKALVDGETANPPAASEINRTAWGDHVCEIAFYKGKYALLSNNKDRSRSMFDAAASHCGNDVLEQMLARKELNRLSDTHTIGMSDDTLGDHEIARLGK